MVRSRSVPAYRLHKSSNQAITTLPDGRGGRRDIYLGEYGSEASKCEYARVVAEWIAAGRQLPQSAVANDLTVNELLLRYWEYAVGYYGWGPENRRGDQANCRDVLRIVKELYGHTSAREFGPLALRAVREQMIRRGWSRSYINHQCGRLLRVFRWAASEELLPASVPVSLATVSGLRKGKTTAREAPPVRPVADEVVDATLPFLPPMVAAMVQLQRMTAARPGEICRLRGTDLDRGGDVWVFRPDGHKTEHHGHTRTILIGPKARLALSPWLVDDPHTFVFSPRRAEELRSAERRRQRQTPLTPSQAQRKPRKKPKRPKGEVYTVLAYRNAIYRAAARAFPPPAELARHKGESSAVWRQRLTDAEKERLRQWRVAHQWHPHQLRHSAATALRKEYGIETAKILLGHSTLSATLTYAERDLAKALEVMRAVG
jgi:integrase